VCLVRTSEQAGIISLYSINWLVFITETMRVYFAVRTGSLHIILRSAHTAYFYVLCGCENKQRLFPYTALTDWFLWPRLVYYAVRTGSLNLVKVSHNADKGKMSLRLIENNITAVKPSGYYTYHKVSQPKFLRSAYTLYLCVSYGSQNKQRLFPIQH
jgi:hypothetical protein